MPREVSRSHGPQATHGHEHKRGKGRQAGSSKLKEKPTEVVPLVVVKAADTNNRAADEDIREFKGDFMTDEPSLKENFDRDESQERKMAAEQKKNEQKLALKEIAEALQRAKSSNHDVAEFNANMADYIRALDGPQFQMVDEDYPVEDLADLVKSITTSISDYRTHSMDTQSQFEVLLDSMKAIRENLHFSVTRQAMDLRADENRRTDAELDLHVKLTQLNAAIAQANADVTEAIRLAAESESSAVRASQAAERAREEAQRVEEEIETKARVERQRKEDERRKMNDQKRQKEEREKKVQDEKRRKEEEWKMREAALLEKSANIYDQWPAVEYEWTNYNGESEITCIARGQPGSFDKKNVTCAVVTEKEEELTYLPNEELISKVIELKSNSGEEKLKSPIYVAIPNVMSRASGLSREPVVKAMVEGEWHDLPTRDVTFDTHKDTKFAQAEVHHLTTLLVMSRLKRDYITLSPRKKQKVTSSFDHRVTLTVAPDTFDEKEHFLLQVQPVDNATVQEFRSRQQSGKAPLTSSPVVHTSWDNRTFRKAIQVTLPCPPNPAKAKKLALARKMKEEKMKQPPRPTMTIDEVEKEKERERKRLQQFSEKDGEKKTVTKWYMGQYANNDDDESDKLYLLSFRAGRWTLEPDVDIRQVKLDVITFEIEQPMEKMLVLRVRTNSEVDSVQAMAATLIEFLSKRFVEAVVRQRADDPFEVALQVTPVSRVDAVVTQLTESGFQSGPAPSHVICLHEGDAVELGFSGNIECKDRLPARLVYKSNVPTVTYFRVKEENRYRQKDHSVYSGLLVLSRKFVDKSTRGKRTDDGEGEVKTERLCALQINIPKHHIEPNSKPKRAPIPIAHCGPIDGSVLGMLSTSLGDEWKLVAHYLGVHRARVQAITRNTAAGEKSDTEAKHEMLITWLKKATRAMDKVLILSSALRNSDRGDLADKVLEAGGRIKNNSRQKSQAVSVR